MNALNFDTGIKEYIVNGGQTLRVNLSDKNLIPGLKRIVKELEEFRAGLPQSGNAEELCVQFDELFKSKLDGVLGEGSSRIIFGSMNILSPANDDGACIFETFMPAFLALVAQDTDKTHAAQAAHIADLVDSKKLDSIAAQITGEAT